MDADKRKKLLKVVEKANTDEAFRKKLLDSTDTVLQEEGIKIPEKMHVSIHENTKKAFFFVVPHKKNPDVKTIKNLPKQPSYHEVALWVMYQVQENTQFKEKLLKNPKELLLEKGVEIPEGIEVHVLENKEHDRHFVLPRMLKSGETFEMSELEKVAGGKGGSGLGGGKSDGPEGQVGYGRLWFDKGFGNSDGNLGVSDPYYGGEGGDFEGF